MEKYITRLNAVGYEQIDGVDCDSTSIAYAATNDAIVVIVLMLSLISGWSELIHVRGTFLLGDFKNGEKIVMSVCQRDFINIIHLVGCCFTANHL
jgi:hypothetical protein